MSILKTVGVFEWSTDYRCEDCKLTFNVSDDSNAATLESKGHECSKPCAMGVGCEQAGMCYAAAHGEPDRCPR